MFTVGQQIGINAASAGVGSVLGLAQSALQHHYNKKLAQYQNDMNIANWNMQNEYNSPINQRARLEQAGLNPALMYGNGGGSTGNASQLPAYQQFGVDIANNMMSQMQMMQMSANIRNMEADTEGKEIDNEWKSQINDAIVQNYLKDVEQKDSVIAINKKTLEKMDVDIAKVNKEIEALGSTIMLQAAQAKSEEARKKLLEAQEALTVLQQATEKVKPDLVNAQTSTAKAQGDLYQANKRLVNAEAVYKEWVNLMIETTGADPNAPKENLIFQVLSKILGKNELDIQEINLKEQAKLERQGQKIKHTIEKSEARHQKQMRRIRGDKDWYIGTKKFEGLIEDGID